VNSAVLSDIGLRCPNVENVSVQFSPYVKQGNFLMTPYVCCSGHVRSCPHCRLMPLSSLLKYSPGACNTLTGDGVAQLLSAVGATLRSIELFRCPNLSDQAVLAVAQRCPALQMFSGPLQVTDASVANVLPRAGDCLPELHECDGCQSDRTVRALAACS
jgi:hypothetical protein